MNEYYEALRHLSRNEDIIQEAWEAWNDVKWETDFEIDDLKESDCIVFNDFSIAFVENNSGRNFASQNGGWVLYSNNACPLDSVIETIEQKMDELREQGFGSDDC